MSYVFKGTNDQNAQEFFDEDSPKRNYRLLLLGAFLILTGLVVPPSLIDAVIEVITDGRLLNWRYLLVCVLLITFAVKWAIDAVNSQRYDLSEDELERNRRFKTMTTVLSIEMIIAVFLHACGQFHSLAIPFLVWFKLGQISVYALLEMFCLITIAALTYYYIRQWLVKFFQA